jgi:hypothetical protein
VRVATNVSTGIVINNPMPTFYFQKLFQDFSFE